jgi:carboxylesterase type B
MMVWYWTCLWLFSIGFEVEGKEPPIVNIPGQGPVSGKEVSVSRTQKATVYLGIPFAQPPTNPRLQPPIDDPLPSWTEVRNSTSFKPACPQDRKALKQHEYILSQILSDQIDALEFSEDCLYLNLFVPDGKCCSCNALCVVPYC